VSLEFRDEAGKDAGRVAFPLPDCVDQWCVLDERIRVSRRARTARINLTAGPQQGKTWFDRITLGIVDDELTVLAQNAGTRGARTGNAALDDQ